jgi:hypothetical protein
MDVQFEEVVGDVVRVIRRIYERAGRVLTPEAIAAFKQKEISQPEHHWGKYSYSAANYGYTPDIIDRRFAEYRKRFIESNTPSKQEPAHA